MENIVKRLEESELICPPKWLSKSIIHISEVGSKAYGCSVSANSDLDLYGLCIPDKGVVFPHISGVIPGFGRQIQRFEQWQEHHIKDIELMEEVDLSVYSIIKIFQLWMDNNPNLLDFLFTDKENWLYTTKFWDRIYSNRHIFLHKGSYFKFLGYAHSQKAKVLNKPPNNSKRFASWQEFGIDTKYLMHLCRLCLECEQILSKGDLNLKENGEFLKDVRKGKMTHGEALKWLEDKEVVLKELYENSTAVPYSPDEQQIKDLLLASLSDYYPDGIDNIYFEDGCEGLPDRVRNNILFN